MKLLRHHYRSWLVPYVDGTLDARRQAKLEALLARDPALAAEAEAQRRTAKRLHATAQTQESEKESAAATLWPSIEARLVPRRRSAVPLLLAGGLCAAAASLAWAAFWGPLRHWGEPTPPPAIAANDSSDGTGNVTVTGVISPHHPRHPRHRPHRSNLLAKRPASLQPDPKMEPSDGQSDQNQPGDRLAIDDGNSPGSDGSDGTGAATPKLAVGVNTHFHFAPLVRPIGHDDIQGGGSDAPGPPSADSTPVKDGGSSSDESDGSSPAAAGTAPDSSAADHPAVTHRSHRRYRHHRRTRGAAGAAKTPDQDTPPETKPTDSAAPKHPTIKPGLID